MATTEQKGRPIATQLPAETIDLARRAADALDDKKAADVVLLDVGDLLQITGVFVIATGTSNRQVKGLADEVTEKIKDRFERRPARKEGVTEAQWVLLDYGDVIVHIFQPDTRAFYDLERLWGDAPRIAWEPATETA